MTTQTELYKVNKFIWNSSTWVIIIDVTINTGKAEGEDNTIEIPIGRTNRNPNQCYFMPKQCFSISKTGNIYPNREKLLSIKSTTDLSVLTAISTSQQGYDKDREPYQWEFDRQAFKEDLMGSTKSINGLVWETMDNYILMNERV
jgi:hypothetical protein